MSRPRRHLDQPAIIQVRDLSVGYPGRATLLDNVTFDIHRGEIFGVLGGSGCGKSTLLKHLIGLVAPPAGSILIDGKDLLSANTATRPQLLRSIGVTYQGGALLGSMTLQENVRLPLEEHTNLSSRAMELVANVKLRQVGLQGFEKYLPAEISGGMRKRAAIARAMALDPKLLFLDEPSAGLDPITSSDLDQLILRLANVLGVTFVIVSHELESIFATNDHVVLLDKTARGVLAEGHPQDLRDSPDPQVRRFFDPKRQAAMTAEADT